MDTHEIGNDGCRDQKQVRGVAVGPTIEDPAPIRGYDPTIKSCGTINGPLAENVYVDIYLMDGRRSTPPSDRAT